jgi:uncharacterized protein (TIGR03067 family)
MLALLAVATPAADVKSALKDLQGTWKAISGEEGGQKASADDIKNMKLVFKGDEFTALHGDMVIMAGTIKLDPAAKPGKIDLISTAGRLQGKTGKGIYELDKNTLKLCLVEPGQERPTDFRAGRGQHLLVYKRQDK